MRQSMAVAMLGAFALLVFLSACEGARARPEPRPPGHTEYRPFDLDGFVMLVPMGNDIQATPGPDFDLNRFEIADSGASLHCTVYYGNFPDTSDQLGTKSSYGNARVGRLTYMTRSAVRNDTLLFDALMRVPHGCYHYGHLLVTCVPAESSQYARWLTDRAVQLNR